MPSKKLDIKKLNGVVYTPEWIVNLILDKLDYIKNVETKRIIDPACGDGAFLKIVIERFIKSAINNGYNKNELKDLLEKNIFGWDINEKAVALCKNNLSDIARIYGIFDVNWNITKRDSLNKFSVRKYFSTFDFVIGNPPYIRIQHLEKQTRSYIQKEWSFCKHGSTDSYIAFFELGYYLLNADGELGYITPDTYTKTSAGKDLRLFIKNNKILKTLIDFRHYQIFKKNATTYPLITILSKKNKNNIFDLYYGDDQQKINFIDKIDIKNLNDRNWILASNKVLQRINKIENRGMPLNKIADIHVGITTLADDYYIFKNPSFDGDTATIQTKDGRCFQIEQKILKPIIKASVLKNSNDIQNRFIIFPYKKVKGKHTIIKEKEMQEKYPLTYNYFLTIKNVLLARDKGKTNPVCWYAFGRSQGLDTSFGRKILTAPINLNPNFIVWEKEEYTFYAGYCIKYDGDLYELAKELNSEDMKFYIDYTSRCYQNNYKSYSKAFIQNFGLTYCYQPLFASYIFSIDKHLL